MVVFNGKGQPALPYIVTIWHGSTEVNDWVAILAVVLVLTQHNKSHAKHVWHWVTVCSVVSYHSGYNTERAALSVLSMAFLSVLQASASCRNAYTWSLVCVMDMIMFLTLSY